MVDLANTVWRDFATAGIPASGKKKPEKSKIREWGTYIESLTMAASYGNTVWFATKALLTADLAHGAGTPAIVYADTTAANNGIYIKVGASGSGSWGQIITYLPGYQFVTATDAGAGTANAIVATSSPRVAYTDGVQLIRLNIYETNTSGTVTVAFDGGAALTIQTASGNAPAIGGLVAGMTVLGVVDQTASVFRMLSDQSGAAIQAAAEAAQVAAEAAAATAQASAGISFATVAALIADTALTYSGGTAVSAGTMVEAGGYRYEVAASGASDHHVTTAGSVKLYALPSIDGFDIRQFPVSTGAADNAAVIQSAMTLAASLNVPLYLGEKGIVWPCTGTVIPTVAGKRLELRGQAKILFSGTGYLDISGTVTDTTYVGTAVAKGSRTLVVNDASGLAVGDVIIIEDATDWSFSASQHTGREAYHAGDFARIAGISTNTLTLEEPLRDGYSAAITSKVYLLNPVDLHTDALEVEASSTPTAAAIASVVVGGQLNLSVKGGNQYAAFFNKLWKTEGRAGRYIHTAPNTGNNYGLVVGNAQDCTFYDVYAYGTRRGIATGTGGGNGGICMRNVKFIGGSSDNGDDTLGSADFHGDADNCAYIGHRATFFDVGGRSCQIIDCEVAPRGSLDPVSWTEIAGGDMVVRNLKVTRPAGATFTNIVSGRNSTQLSKIAENYSITVDGVEIENGATLVGIVGFYHAAASPIRVSVFVDRVNILGGAPTTTFRLLNSTVANPASHAGGVAAPVKLQVGDNCVWPMANTHFFILTSGSHTGTKIWAPSQTVRTTFTVLSANSISTDQLVYFIGYPFEPSVVCQSSGLTSAAGTMFYGMVATRTGSSATVNVTSGNSATTAGADRTLAADVLISMNGVISA